MSDTYYILQDNDKTNSNSWQPTVWDSEPVGFEWMTEEQYTTMFPPVIEETVPPTEEEQAAQAELEAQAKRAAEAQEFLMGVMEVYNEQ